MEEKNTIRYTPDYIDSLLPGQVFVFGSNTLGYHTGGASATARKKFGAIWGQAEGLQGQSYAIPVDYGKNVRKDEDVKAAVERFVDFAKEHTEFVFLVTRVGCGIAGYKDEEMACFFKEALTLKNVHLPRSFVDLLNGSGINYDIERFFSAQDSEPDSYNDALRKIKQGKMQGLWIGYIFPQIKGLGHSYRSEFYGISGKEEAKAYLDHPELGKRLREITSALLNRNNSSAENILGFPGVLKVKSCMTLFDFISPNDIFNEVLEKFYEGKRCERTIWRLSLYENKLNHQIKLSRLTITKDYSFILSDYSDKEVKMEPLAKAVYLLFLNHPEGIVFKCLPNYKEELITLYSKIKPCSFNDKTVKSIEDITNPLLNSINEKCSRIKAAFLTIVDISLADQYYVTGKSGEPKKITLPRDLVNFQGL